MIAQWSLFDSTEPDDVGAQLRRLPEEVRVWLDSALERGAEMMFLSDVDAERERLMAAAQSGLRWSWVSRHRGVRRAWHKEAPSIGLQWHVAYEPRMERELGRTGRQSEQRFYWPKRLTP